MALAKHDIQALENNLVHALNYNDPIKWDISIITTLCLALRFPSPVLTCSRPEKYNKITHHPGKKIIHVEKL